MVYFKLFPSSFSTETDCMGTTPMTSGQMKDLILTAIQAVPANHFSFEQAEELLSNKRGLSDQIQQVFLKNENYLVESPSSTVAIVNASPNIDHYLDEWKVFWKQVASIEVDISRVLIPFAPTGFDQFILMPEEAKMTNNSIFDLCSRHFEKPCWRYCTNLDEVITYHDRDPNRGSYAIWVRDRQEADEENQHLPPRHFWSEEPDDVPRLSKIATETYLERMVHGLYYWHRTKKHLDMESGTICAASRYRGGSSPFIGWRPGDSRVGVGYCSPGGSSSNWSARSVASFRNA